MRNVCYSLTIVAAVAIATEPAPSPAPHRRTVPGCATSDFDTCLLDSGCIWNARTHSCLDATYVEADVNSRWKKGSDGVYTGVSTFGDVYQWQGLGVTNKNDTENATPDWDVVCENGGVKRWVSATSGAAYITEKGLDGGNNPIWGNTECTCPEGRAGLTCGLCTLDAACPGDSTCEGEETPLRSAAQVEMTCNPTHNGMTSGAAVDMGHDAVIALLNDYTVGLDRLYFSVSAGGFLEGGLLKPVRYFGHEGKVESPHLFRFSSTSQCVRSETKCQDWVDKRNNGVDALQMPSPWTGLAPDAKCTSWDCDELDVQCPPDTHWAKWFDTCDQFLSGLFKGSVQMVCNSEMRNATTGPSSANFSASPYGCVMWVYSGDIAFSSECNTGGRCVAPSNSTTNSSTVAPAAPPSFMKKHHGYCNRHRDWCYPTIYFLIYLGPCALVVAAAALFVLCGRAGCLPPHAGAPTGCLSACVLRASALCGCEGGATAAKREAAASGARARKASVEKLVARLMRGSTLTDLEAGVGGGRSGGCTADLSIPFLISDAADATTIPYSAGAAAAAAAAAPAAAASGGGETWLHCRDVRFSISPDMLQQAMAMGEGGGGGGGRTHILNGVTACAGPGMTAILGPSGCGKTSLLDIIAGRKTLGTVGGTVMLNGRELTVSQRRRQIGYVTQEDVLQPSATVREVLAFHAALRMPASATGVERAAAVEAMLRTLRLHKRADTCVGSAEHKGISGGEKRRVSIGVQLLGGCRAMVLDEPLSGLDSSCALGVLEALENLVKDRTHAVLMTIHQPSARLFTKFGRIMLLSPHGHLVYSGPRRGCIDHFEDIGLPALPQNYSPPEYLLDVVSPHVSPSVSSDLSSAAGDQAHGGDAEDSDSDEAKQRDRLARRELRLARLYVKSDVRAAEERCMAALEESAAARAAAAAAESPAGFGGGNATGGARAPAPQGYAALEGGADESEAFEAAEAVGSWTQFKVLLQRAVQNTLRVPALAVANIGLAAVTGGVCALVFSNLTTDLQGLISRGGLFFFALSYFMLSTIVALGLWQEERLLYLHERASGAYGPTPYFLARTLVDTAMLRLLPVCAFSVTLYWTANLRWHPLAMVYFGLTLFLSSTCAAAIMSCVAMLVRRLPTAQLIGAMYTMCSMLLAGMLLNAGTLGSLKWLLHLSPLSYGFNTLMINEFGRNAIYSIRPRGMKVSAAMTGTQVLDTFYIKEEDFDRNMVGLAVYTGAFLLLAYLLQRYFLKEQR